MSEPTPVIYYGNRDEAFKCFIKNILSLAKMKEKYIDLLTDDEGMKIYDQVFTHPTVDEERNYEFYELLGDQTLNKAIVWYLSRRFPELHCPTGVKIMSRLKINLVAKKVFSDMAMKLGFWPYVSADEETRLTKLKKTLEDVFEAFFGATETMLDEKVRYGVGYHFCYNIISVLLDDMTISLKYEDLYDAKTRLKETFDWHRDKLKSGRLFKEKYEAVKQDKINFVSVYNEGPFGRQLIGQGSAALKEDAEQRAAENAIINLKVQKLMKPIPDEYSDFEKRLEKQSEGKK